MPKLVEFRAPDEARDAIIEMLEEALEKARKGHVLDAAVVLSVRGADGPGFEFRYWGQSAFASLVCGVSALQFDLHYQPSKDREA